MYSSTIEPRLIALLNNDAASELSVASPRLELPPLHDPNILKASGRPPALEPDTSKGHGKPTPNPPLSAQHSGLLKSVDGDDNLHLVRGTRKRSTGVADRALGNSSPQSLKKILSDSTRDGSAPSPSKKRNIVEGKDEFVQLPQPPKKQKASKQAVLVPPIIIGLFEPPPQAALFPPIASSSFHDRRGRNSLNTIPTSAREPEDRAKLEASTNNKGSRRSTAKRTHQNDVKPRKRWTEEETNNLLLGVSKHGVGRWTDILEDPSFSFNGRSGVDLKDRFRTCCPDELRGKGPKHKNSSKWPDNPRAVVNQKNQVSSLLSENILIEKDEICGGADATDAPVCNKKAPKSRAHRKNLEDLAELGIEGPFRKSQRRERRPFSEQDDREILLGYNIYGPAWTRIQRDSQFHLQSRQPTDLRDRFRNKYPEKYRSDDTTPKDSHKSDARGTDISSAAQSTFTLKQPSSREGLRVHQMVSDYASSTSISHSLHSHSSSLEVKDPFSEQVSESTDGLPSFDWNGSVPFTGSMGEMDISRLLLDESWIDASSGKDKQTFTDINSIISSNAEHVPSFYNMLVNDDHINMSSSSVTLDHDSSF